MSKHLRHALIRCVVWGCTTVMLSAADAASEPSPGPMTNAAIVTDGGQTAELALTDAATFIGPLPLPTCDACAVPQRMASHGWFCPDCGLNLYRGPSGQCECRPGTVRVVPYDGRCDIPCPVGFVPTGCEVWSKLGPVGIQQLLSERPNELGRRCGFCRCEPGIQPNATPLPEPRRCFAPTTCAARQQPRCIDRRRLRLDKTAGDAERSGFLVGWHAALRRGVAVEPKAPLTEPWRTDFHPGSAPCLDEYWMCGCAADAIDAGMRLRVEEADQPHRSGIRLHVRAETTDNFGAIDAAAIDLAAIHTGQSFAPRLLLTVESADAGHPLEPFAADLTNINPLVTSGVELTYRPIGEPGEILISLCSDTARTGICSGKPQRSPADVLGTLSVGTTRRLVSQTGDVVYAAARAHLSSTASSVVITLSSGLLPRE